MKTADSLYYDLELRLRDIDGVIARGNEALKILIASGEDKIFYRQDMRTGAEIVKELESYAAEKRCVVSLIQFYNSIII